MRLKDKHKNKHFFSKSKHIAISRNTYVLYIGIEGIETNRNNNKGNENER